MRRLCNATIAICVAASLGCLVEAPGSTPQSSKKVAGGANVIKEAPPLQIRNGAIFDNRVEVVGAKLEPGRWAASIVDRRGVESRGARITIQ